MLNTRKLVIAASIFAVTGFLVSGERAEAVTGNASATIAIPVTIAETTALDHGTVTASGSIGTEAGSSRRLAHEAPPALANGLLELQASSLGRLRAMTVAE